MTKNPLSRNLSPLTIVLTVSALIGWVNSAPSQTCAFRGTCGRLTNAFGIDLPIPCVYSGPPTPVHNETSLGILRQYLPEYFSSGNTSQQQQQPLVFCCTDEQPQQMVDQMDISRKFLGHCPSCYYNYARLFFAMSCAPNQAEMVTVLASNSTTKAVETIEYRVSGAHAHSLYQSCANVHTQPPGPSSFKVVEKLLCGGGGAQNCTSDAFLHFLGSKGVAPMEIRFNQTLSEGHSNELPTYKCSVAPKPFSDKVCACGDCLESCHH